MGEAILSRILETGIYLPDEVMVSEPRSVRRQELAQRYGIRVTADNNEAITASIILLAIKPQVFELVATSIAPVLSPTNLVISIMAGISLTRLETELKRCSVIRAMPNTPVTVGSGITAIAPNSLVSSEQLAQAYRIFQATGEVVEVSESLMDGVTALSGSGPAYVAMFLEAMADGGVAVGLPRAIAQKLAIQTVLGTVQLLHEQKLHPAQLKDNVTSPGGTTIAAITQLEKLGFRSAIIEAILAANRRSQELG